MAPGAQQALTIWQKQLQSEVDERLRALLEKAVDTLMNLAEQAGSDQLQGGLFHAQQEIRRDKDRIRHDFLRALDEQMRGTSAWQHRPDGVADNLDLINIERFERDVAIQRIADRACQEHHALLHQLRLRLSVLNQGASIEDGDIPGGPVQLLRALDDALRPLALDRVAQTKVFELFDRELLREFAGGFYQRLSEQLRDAGVLRNLRFEITTRPYRGRSDTAADSAAIPTDTGQQHLEAANNSVDSELVEDIRTLMTPPRQPAGSGPSNAPEDSAAIATLIEQAHEQIGALLPEHQMFSADAEPGQIGPEHVAQSLDGLGEQRRAIKRMVGPGKLSAFDESTLDIVGALFEMMLGDRRLTAPIKALLSHLHTPYLKLALRDRALLTKADHPARELLDELVDAGETWGQVEYLGQGIFPTLQHIVETVRQAGVPSRELLEQQRTELAEQVESLSRRQQLRLNRTTESERGRARLDQAKHTAHNAVVHLIGDMRICQAAADFLMTAWQDYLTLLLLKHDGEPGSDEWQEAEQLAQRIIRAGSKLERTEQPSTSELWEIQQGLEDNFLPFIPHCSKEAEKLLAALHQLADKEVITQQITTLRAASIPDAKPSPAQASPQASELSAAEQQTAAHLRKLTGNTRFRIPMPDGSGSRLVTLTWFNPHTDRMLFVDQEGAKAALLPVTELAQCLHSGKAQLVRQKQHPFFTRALRALKQYLEKHVPVRQGAAHG